MLGLLSIAGGVALLLFAVRTLRKGLDRLFGKRLGTIMQRTARTRPAAFFAGLGVAVIAPSSTTMSLLAVHSVQAGHLSTRKLLTVMLGANVGLTVLVQLIALRLDAYAPLLILAGVTFYQIARTRRWRGTGQVMLSLGLIFLAMAMIQEQVEFSGLTSHADFIQLVDIARNYPIALCALTALLAAMLQSGTATIGLFIGLGTAGAIGIDIGVPVVIGANIGIGLTMLVVGWNQLESRRLAAGNLLLKCLVATILLVVFYLVRDRLPTVPAEEMGQTLASLHIGFNVVLAIIGLPLVSVTTRLIERIVPESGRDRERHFGPRFINSAQVDSTALALGQSLREILHVAEVARSMLDQTWTALKTNDETLAREAGDRDDRIDALEKAIKRYLTRIVSEETDALDADEQMRQLRYLNELETIGDIIDRNLCQLVLKKVRRGATFSEEGEAELDEFHQHIVRSFELAVTAFNTQDHTLAQQLLRHTTRVAELESELRDHHFHRLTAGLAESHHTSSIHLDLLTHLNRINDSLAHVAQAILRESSTGESSSPAE